MNPDHDPLLLDLVAEYKAMKHLLNQMHWQCKHCFEVEPPYFHNGGLPVAACGCKRPTILR